MTSRTGHDQQVLPLRFPNKTRRAEAIQRLAKALRMPPQQFNQPLVVIGTSRCQRGQNRLFIPQLRAAERRGDHHCDQLRRDCASGLKGAQRRRWQAVGERPSSTPDKALCRNHSGEVGHHTGMIGTDGFRNFACCTRRVLAQKCKEFVCDAQKVSVGVEVSARLKSILG